MRTLIIYFVLLFFIHATLKSQTDTLTCSAEYNIPNVGATSSLNLAYDGTNFWLSEHLSGIIYTINPDGLCLDTLNASKTTSIEFVGDTLWMVHNDWLWKLNKKTGQVLDSVKINFPEGMNVSSIDCRDLCYFDSAIYSVWAYCWCGVYRFLKLDLKTNATADLGDIPLYDNLVVINDTIWSGNKELFPIFTKNSMVTLNRSLYLGNFQVSGLAFDNNNLWVIDFDNKKLKKMDGSSIVTSNKKMIFGDRINIFPNPASDYIIINTNETERNCLIELFDINGRVVISDKQRTKTYKLDLKEIEPGQYLFRLSCGNIFISRSIIKN